MTIEAKLNDLSVQAAGPRIPIHELHDKSSQREQTTRKILGRGPSCTQNAFCWNC